MQNTVCIAVLSESWLLNLREFLEKALILSRSFDDLKGGERVRCGEGCWNGINNPVVHKTKDPLPLEINTQVVGVKEVGAKEWTSNIGQDELVLERNAGKV